MSMSMMTGASSPFATPRDTLLPQINRENCGTGYSYRSVFRCIQNPFSTLSMVPEKTTRSSRSGLVHRRFIWASTPDSWSLVSRLKIRPPSHLNAKSTSFNIEPFFFSSSLNWIPSRFQEEVRAGEKDRKLSFALRRPFLITIRLRCHRYLDISPHRT
jgi:hypothetical protein